MTKSTEEVPAEIPRLMNMPGTLTFTAEGRWLHAGEEITHEKIRDYFSRHLHYSKDHAGYVIEVDGKCVRAEVEDTAVVVRTIDTQSTPWRAYLSGDVEEDFRPETLVANAEGIFYCTVSEDRRARLMRPAWQSLLPFLQEPSAGEFELTIGDKSFPVRQIDS